MQVSQKQNFVPNVEKHVRQCMMCTQASITTLNVPEMRPLGSFSSILSNGYHGNDDH